MSAKPRKPSRGRARGFGVDAKDERAELRQRVVRLQEIYERLNTAHAQLRAIMEETRERIRRQQTLGRLQRKRR